MMKKVALSKTFGGLQCCLSTQHPLAGGSNKSTSPLNLPQQRARPDNHTSKSSPERRRTYATSRSRTPPDFRDNFHWPCRHDKTSQVTPTPYEIFDIEKHATYSKNKFYDLVKIYHPDRKNHHNSSTHWHSLAPVERLERYRLIVQAHQILSNPVRRRAYDSHGAGWGERASTITSAQYTADDADSPFTNATWEDWERWYQRQRSSDPASTHNTHTTTQSYAGTYFNPNLFAAFVILAAVISGVAQATAATQYTGSIEQKALAFTEETARFLDDRKDQYVTSNLSSEGRIRWFLERRDPTKYGLSEEEERIYRKTFGGGHLSDGGVERTPMPPSPRVLAEKEKGQEKGRIKARKGVDEPG